ncbi:MAG TPA: c-type cytochrome domain-containing protein, partial [Verrucomicrobiota bacterium]|nr:c-type cytochrome domain-containing protein [Verrucomicrobiota bacterium]
MGSVFRQHFFCLLAAVLGLPLGQAATVTFEADVRPILKAHCFHCHGEDGTAKGGLDVRLRRLLLKGGKHGPA